MVGPAAAALRVDAEDVEVSPTKLQHLRAEPLREVEHRGMRPLPLLAVTAGVERLRRAQVLDAISLGVEAGGRDRGEVR